MQLPTIPMARNGNADNDGNIIDNDGNNCANGNDKGGIGNNGNYQNDGIGKRPSSKTGKGKQSLSVAGL